MDIFEAINNSSSTIAYKPINSLHHMDILNHREYEYIYKELKYKNSFHFVDEKGLPNFLARIESEKEIELVMKNKKNINIIRESIGPVLELNINGMERRYKYAFDLENSQQLYNIKRLIENREGYIHFIVYGENRATKCFSAIIQIDDRILKRFNYMINLCYQQSYPIIEFKEYEKDMANYFTVEDDNKVLEKVLDTVSNLQKWGSKDNFSVYIVYDNNYKFLFSGDVTNYKYIKTEVAKNFEISDEGTISCSGKPFVKYEMGMLYFFKGNINDNDSLI